MHTGQRWGILGHTPAALACILALAATGVASGTPIPSAIQIMGDAAHNVWTLGRGVVYENGNTAG